LDKQITSYCGAGLVVASLGLCHWFTTGKRCGKRTSIPWGYITR
jgi:hypothetical protein